MDPVFYSAVPPSSALFRRLRSERPFALLMAALFSCGPGVFHFFDDDDGIWAEERDEMLNQLVDRHRDVLGPEPEARHWISEFRLELDRTRSEFVGFEHRTTSLFVTPLFRGRVSRQLARSGRVPGMESVFFLERLIYGDEIIVSCFKSHALGLASVDLVRTGAQALNGLDAVAIFPGQNEDGELDGFDHWQRLYLDAAQRAEALLVQ